MNEKPEGFAVFNEDAEKNEGYLYTTNVGLSSKLATDTSLNSVMVAGQFGGKRVVDIGCGDGHYSVQYWDGTGPESLTGIDAAEGGIKVANKKKGDRKMTFQTGNSHRLPFPDDSFDIALLQAMLHHDDDPYQSIAEALRVAPEVVIHEPNGWNLGLKVIEKLSPYHRMHAEKSYTHWEIGRWIRNAGGEIVVCSFRGFVPMFCPDWLAKATKAIEPIVEHTPLLNMAGCAVYTIIAKRQGSKGGAR